MPLYHIYQYTPQFWLPSNGISAWNNEVDFIVISSKLNFVRGLTLFQYNPVLSSLSHLSHFVTSFPKTGIRKKSASCNEAVRACISTGSNSPVSLDPTIHLNINIQITFKNDLTEFPYFIQHCWNVRLTAKPWIHRHYKYVVHHV